MTLTPRAIRMRYSCAGMSVTGKLAADRQVGATNSGRPLSNQQFLSLITSLRISFRRRPMEASDLGAKSREERKSTFLRMCFWASSLDRRARLEAETAACRALQSWRHLEASGGPRPSCTKAPSSKVQPQAATEEETWPKAEFVALCRKQMLL